MFEALKEFLAPGWVGSLLSLAGLIAGIGFYRASIVGARPVYRAGALQLLGKDPTPLAQDVTILYRGEEVQRLTRTLVAFWNSGRSLCRGEDIVAQDPVLFRFATGVAILRIEVLRLTRPVTGFVAHVTPDRTAVRCEFDYLDPGDGAVLEILHTGDDTLPTCTGTLRGVPRGILNWGPLETFDLAAIAGRTLGPLWALLMLSCGLCLFVMTFVERDLGLFAVGLTMALGTYCLTVGWGLIRTLRHLPPGLRARATQAGR